MLNILYEDTQLVVVIKPFGTPVQPDKSGDESLLEQLQKHFNKEIYLIHRLDRTVGGVMVFAKDKKSAGFLSQEMQNQGFNKQYLSVLCGSAKDNDDIEDYLIKNQTFNISKIVHKNNKGAKYAHLCYEKIKEIDTENYGRLSLVKIKLFTGRHHQIRVQMAGQKLPLFGDTKYNEMFKRARKITLGLWSYNISFKHPKTLKDISFTQMPDDIEPFSFF